MLPDLRAPVPRWTLLIVVALVAAFGAWSYFTIKGESEKRVALGVENRVALCESIDADHNRERARIITNEVLIYSVPAFKVLIGDPRAEWIAYKTARDNYLSVRRTRPPFCRELVANPVKDFPSLQDFQEGRVKLPAPPSMD
jgi:hypothetical protein